MEAGDVHGISRLARVVGHRHLAVPHGDRVTIPPFTWLALTLLLHASRSMTASAGLPCLWIAFYVAFAIGDRDIVPIPGPEYYAIVAFLATAITLPFAADRFAISRIAGVRATLVFPLGLVAAEFLRVR